MPAAIPTYQVAELGPLRDETQVRIQGTVKQTYGIETYGQEGKTKCAMTISDDSGTIKATAWKPDFAPAVGQFVSFRGKLSTYKGNRELSGFLDTPKEATPERPASPLPPLSERQSSGPDPWEGAGYDAGSPAPQPAPDLPLPTAPLAPSKPTEQDWLEMHRRLLGAVIVETGSFSQQNPASVEAAWSYASSVVCTGLIAWGKGEFVASQQREPGSDDEPPFKF